MLPQESTPVVVRSSKPQKHPHPPKKTRCTFKNNSLYQDLSGGIASTDLTMTLDGTRAMGWVACVARSLNSPELYVAAVA